jgi:Dockerin type I domain
MIRMLFSIFGFAGESVRHLSRKRVRRPVTAQVLEGRRLLAASALDVQIVQVCNDAETTCAPLGPNDTSLATPNEYAYTTQVNEIFRQAEIEVNFNFTRWNNTAALRLSADEQNQLFDNNWSAGAAPPPPISGIQFFFVQDFPNTGYDPSNPNSGWVGAPLPNPTFGARAAGFAQLGIEGFTTNYRAIMANEGFAADSLAGILAHEIGHALGLRHINERGSGTVNDPTVNLNASVPNLMWAAGQGPAYDPAKSLIENNPLTPAQIDAVIANGQPILKRITTPESLVLTLSNDTVAENAGNDATMLTVRRTGDVLTTDQTITLSSSDPGEAIVQQEIVIPAGADSATAAITAVDDTLLETDQTVQFTASASGLNSGTVDLTVTDHETLTAEFSALSIVEDKSTGDVQLTLRRSNTSNTEQPLTVTVTGGDPSQLDISASLTIPANSAEVEIVLQPVDDSVAELMMTLAYTFAAAGYVSASGSIDLLDDEPPKFQNPVSSTDVDTLNGTTAVDALIVINELGRRGGAAQLDPTDQTNRVFLDVNGDYMISALDALIVINQIARQANTESEIVQLIPVTVITRRDDESDEEVLEWELSAW